MKARKPKTAKERAGELRAVANAVSGHDFGGIADATIEFARAVEEFVRPNFISLGAPNHRQVK